MSEFGDLLELLFNARNSFRSYHATIRRWWHEGRSAEAFLRFEASRPPESVVSLGKAASPSSRRERESFYRVWLQTPGCRRYESYRGNLSTGPQVVSVENGTNWWNFSNWGMPGRPPELHTNVFHGRAASTATAHPRRQSHGGGGHELHDPSFLLYMFSLELSGRTSHMGQDAIRVKGWPREEIIEACRGMAWDGVDECEFLVNAEFGTLLRSASLIGGLEVNVQEVVAVAFNEGIDPYLFEFKPPPGTLVQVVTEYDC